MFTNLPHITAACFNRARFPKLQLHPFERTKPVEVYSWRSWEPTSLQDPLARPYDPEYDEDSQAIIWNSKNNPIQVWKVQWNSLPVEHLLDWLTPLLKSPTLSVHRACSLVQRGRALVQWTFKNLKKSWIWIGVLSNHNSLEFAGWPCLLPSIICNLWEADTGEWKVVSWHRISLKGDFGTVSGQFKKVCFPHCCGLSGFCC